jgi:hypothetical protein
MLVAMPARRPLAVLLPTFALGCGGPPSEGFSPTMEPPITSAPASTTTSGMSTGDTTAVAGEAGSSDAGGGSGEGSTGMLYDLGAEQDLWPAKPTGCKGKIDFLFTIQVNTATEATQQKLIEAFPAFIATIEERFAEFDVHIMVTDADQDWGIPGCDPQGCLATGNNGCELDDWSQPDYPCEYGETLDKCDHTLGAGTVCNAGPYAANTPCAIDDDRRYITQDQTDLAGTFTCMARVGRRGDRAVGQSIVNALSPKFNAEDGCNAGFLRDDALLMITFVATGDDLYKVDSPGTPQDWADAVFAAKHGDQDAVVVLGIGGDANDPPSVRLLQFLAEFPHSLREYIDAPNFTEAFAEAVTLVEEVCDGFTPPG